MSSGIPTDSPCLCLGRVLPSSGSHARRLGQSSCAFVHEQVHLNTQSTQASMVQNLTYNAKVCVS